MQNGLEKKQDLSETGSQSHDPRNGCCWEGKYFLDAFKAILVRQMFIVHAVLAVWRVTVVTNIFYWLFCLSLGSLLVETGVILLKRRGQEWSWFQWSIFLYLCCVIPPTWILELDRIGLMGELLNNTSLGEDVNGAVPTITLGLNTDDWMTVLQQGLLVILIIGRWLMPKGELTREQLSGLLLTHLGTASDIVDFLTILQEPNIIGHVAFTYAVLVCWSWSLMQFPFVITCTKELDEEDIYEDITDEEEDYITGTITKNKKKKKKKKNPKMSFEKGMKLFRHFFETEAWGIFVSMIMQDGPFFIIRLVAILAYSIKTYTNYFFTAKNALVLALQIYRLYSLYQESKMKQQKSINAKGPPKITNLYRGVFKVNPTGSGS